MKKTNDFVHYDRNNRKVVAASKSKNDRTKEAGFHREAPVAMGGGGFSPTPPTGSSNMRRSSNGGGGMLPNRSARAPSPSFAPPTEFRAMAMLDFGPSLQMPGGGSSGHIGSRGAGFLQQRSAPSFATNLDFKKAPPAAATTRSVQRPSSSSPSWIEEATKSTVQPKSTPISFLSESPYGWNPEEAQLGALPLFYPQDLVKLELPKTEFLPTLERAQNCFRRHSIQAVFAHNAPTTSAKLQTVDRVEFKITFWQAIDEHNFYVDIQRYRGDHMNFCTVLHRVLDAIKGIDVDNDMSDSVRDDEEQEQAAPIPMVSLDKIKEIQAIMERMIPVAAAAAAAQTQSSEGSAVEAVIHSAHASLTSRCFLERAAGLECLVSFTDMRHTMVSAARQGALAFLRGQAPPAQHPAQQEELNRKCHGIQQIIFKILQHGEFEGDESLRQHLDHHENKITTMVDFQPFMGNGKRKRFPKQYEDAMSGSTHKAMAILVNSLEVLSCDGEQGSGGTSSSSVEQVLQEFFIRCEECTHTDLYKTLIDCVDQCDDQMAMGYLACKALRLLLPLFPPLKHQLQGDSRARRCVEKACQAGRSCHSLLETESKMLRDGIRSA